MSLQNTKLFIGGILLLAYVSIGVFGLFQFNHTNKVLMNDCPYSLNTYSICKDSIDHINNWHIFSNAVFPALIILSIILFIITSYFFDRNKFFRQNLGQFYEWAYDLDDKFFQIYHRKITYWLSLFENSPPVNIR